MKFQSLIPTHVSNAKPANSVTDSTAILLRYVYDFLEAKDSWHEKYETREYSLIFVDTRTENIYWKKDIVPKRDYHSAHVTLNAIDSVLIFFKEGGWDKSRRINQIAFKNLKDEMQQQSNQIELKYKEIELVGEGWRYTDEVRARPWHSGFILANSFFKFRDEITNNYAFIDTIAGTMELWQPSGEFEWMNDCMDVRWSSVA